MTIGSKTLGTAPVAGALGVISPAQTVATIQQTVAFRAIEPAQRLVTLEQTIAGIEPARRLVNIQQRVINATAPKPKVPSAYIWIGGDIKAGLKGVQISWSTALNTVRVTHNEDQSATADIFVFQPINAPINIPSFHGKQLIIETHLDPTDINSEIIPLFTGWVETARYDRTRRGIAISGSDLRDERLGREDAQQIQSLTGALYSTVTQREEVEGPEYVTELMKTVTGSIGYARDGSLLYYNWGASRVADATYTDAGIAYNDIQVEFQTRSSIINSISIEIEYQYSLLRTVSTEVDAYKERMFRTGGSGGSPEFDGKTFRRNDLLSKFESFSPWELISYRFYDLERFTNYRYGGNTQYVIDAVWSGYGKRVYAQGIKADLTRRIAQPVREKYTLELRCPQSIDAYRTTVDGPKQTYSLVVEYDRRYWEDDFKQVQDPASGNLGSTSVGVGGTGIQPDNSAARIADEVAKADNRRSDLAAAFNAAYAIAKKGLVAAHRKNYVSFTRLQKTDAVNIGDVVQLNTRIIQTTGQIDALTYTIADGIRNTEYRLAISYMDTAQAAPIENWAAPETPVKPESDAEIISTAEYNTEKRAFDIRIGDIGEQITDELEQPQTTPVYDVPLENTDITLINGY